MFKIKVDLIFCVFSTFLMLGRSTSSSLATGTGENLDLSTLSQEELDLFYSKQEPVSLEDSYFWKLGKYREFDVDPSTIEKDCEIKHVHLSKGTTQMCDSMTVSFSISKTCKTDKTDILLGYSTIKDELFDESDGVSKIIDVGNSFKESEKPTSASSILRKSYSFKRGGEQFKHMPAYKSNFIYHVPLRNLKCSQDYFYQITVKPKEQKNPLFEEISKIYSRRQLASSDQTTTPVFSFNTSNSGETGTKFAIVADLGQTKNSTLTMLNIYKEVVSFDPSSGGKPVSLALCAGDMSYADSNQTRWDTWFTIMEPLLSILPLQVAVGNHEGECDDEKQYFLEPYESRFLMPNPKPSILLQESKCSEKHPLIHYDYGNSFYAFTDGLTRVIAVNPYTPTHESSTQYKWLKSELETIDRSVTPWVLVMAHNPIYNTFHAHQHEGFTNHMQENFEPLFIKHMVNVVIAGHTHGYSRSHNVAYGKLSDTAPIYITVGEGGNRELHCKKYLNEIPEEWVAARDKTEYGYGSIEFLDETTAHWKWNHNADDGIESIFTDQAIIKNQYFV